MKIAVFGDSFACRIPYNKTPSWVDLLSMQHDVTNFAEQGSSLFYSLRLFLESQSNFDKVIFVITTPGRLHLEGPLHLDKMDQFVAGLASVEFKLANLEKKQHKHFFKYRLFNALKEYYALIQNTDYDRHVHYLMVNEIKSIRPDAILIPTAATSMSDYKGQYTMDDISKYEISAWDSTVGDIRPRDTRNSHMTVENNEIFFKHVLRWLDGQSVVIDLKNFVQPMNKEFYFDMVDPDE